LPPSLLHFQKPLTERVRSLLEGPAGEVPAITRAIGDLMLGSTFQDRAIPLEEAVLRLEFLAGGRLGPGSATAAEAPNM